MKTLFTCLLTSFFALNCPAQPIGALEEERLSQSGVAITIIFDDSGSMNSDNRMDQAKAAFKQWLGGIPPETKLGLIALNRGVLVPLDRNNRETITNEVANMDAYGGTPLTRTISRANDLIQERRKTVTPYERHIVIVFTDGEDSEFPKQKVVETLRELGKNTIETVGIGFHGEGDYLEQGSTQYYNASDATELVQALKEVASEVDQQSDIVVTPEIAAEMAKVSNVAKTDEPAGTIVQSETRKGFSFKMIIFIILFGWVGFKILKSIIRKAKR